MSDQFIHTHYASGNEHDILSGYPSKIRYNLEYQHKFIKIIYFNTYLFLKLYLLTSVILCVKKKIIIVMDTLLSFKSN